MAVGVGVVVSAFRLTPFFCRKKKIKIKNQQTITPGPLHSKPFPSHCPKQICLSIPWQGAELGELQIQQGAGVQQNAET